MIPLVPEPKNLSWKCNIYWSISQTSLTLFHFTGSRK